MKTLRCLDGSGDTAISFDETEATATARAEAEALFKRMAEGGASVFNVTPGTTDTTKRITAFDQVGEEAIIVPKVVGG